MKIFTIGFTKTSAKHFFKRLIDANVKNIIDVRLNNVSQLAGFAKKDDLEFFARSIGNIGYCHIPDLAPTQEMLDAYKKQKGTWSDYEENFNNLISQRHIERIDQSAFDGACLLCSEDKAHHCHRRLVAEYFQRQWGGVDIEHL